MLTKFCKLATRFGVGFGERELWDGRDRDKERVRGKKSFSCHTVFLLYTIAWHFRLLKVGRSAKYWNLLGRHSCKIWGQIQWTWFFSWHKPHRYCIIWKLKISHKMRKMFSIAQSNWGQVFPLFKKSKKYQVYSLIIQWLSFSACGRLQARKVVTCDYKKNTEKHKQNGQKK